MVKKLLLILLCLLNAKSLQAEILNCDGLWTNQPCSSEPQRVIPEVKLNEEDPAEIEKRRNSRVKESVIHDLRMAVIRSKEDYGVELDISEAEELCQRGDSELAECRRKVADFDQQLQERINQVRLVRAQEEANRLQQQKNDAQNNASAVTIVNQPKVRRLRPRHPYISCANTHGRLGDCQHTVEQRGFSFRTELSGAGGTTVTIGNQVNKQKK